MSRTHVMALRLLLAILLLGLSFLLSIEWITLPHVHFFFVALGAVILCPSSGDHETPTPGWQTFLALAFVLTWSLMEEAFLARTGMELIDSLWWKIPFHLWFLGIMLSEASKAFRLARPPQTISASG